MSASAGQRDIVFCHQCSNEWYRDESGLVCPRCHSDFTEVVEPNHDPRGEAAPGIGDFPPDPDEDDISDSRWGRDPHQGQSYTYTRNTQSNNPPQSPHGDQDAGPMFGAFASMLNGMLGGRPPPAGWHDTGSPRSPWLRPPAPGMIPPDGTGRGGIYGQTLGSPPQSPDHQRSNSAPGWRPPGQRTGGFHVSIGGGPTVSWSVTTDNGVTRTTRTSRGGGPPGFGDMDPFYQTMFAPLGHHGLRGDPTGHRYGPGSPHGPQDEDPFTAMGPLGPLLAGIFGNPTLMRSGDAVYSQEALDRIMTQLMEQNSSGNAPGPAPEEAIAALPKRAVNEKDLGQEHKAECSICMEEVNLGEMVTELPCHHWFHGECVKAWLTEHDTCPHCRQGIMPKEGEADAGRPRNPSEAPRHDQMWGQGNGTRANPYTIPESPSSSRPSTRRRHSSAAGSSSRNSGGDGLLSRMRNAFGGGSGGSS